MKINKTLIKVGDSIIVDVCKLSYTPTKFIENINGINSHVILERTYSQSKDGKNWDIYKKISYGWLETLEVGNYVRVKYSLLQNLLQDQVEISEVTIKEEVKNLEIDQRQSFLLSAIKGIIDLPSMSKQVEIIERDMNYFINSSSPIQVNYWHTNPDKESTDEFLHEYSLHNVVSNKFVRCVLKDNKIPEPKHEFSQWGIDFEKLEIYFEKSYFEEIFGINEKPRQNDYMYFKEINRMYYISDCYLDRGVNENGTNYICVIKKYEDMTNVEKNQTDLEYLMENLPIDDYSDDQLDEMEDMTNNTQNLAKDAVYDTVKKFTHKNLLFENDNFYNNGNQITDYYYNMNFESKNKENKNLQVKAVSYNSKINIKDNEGISIMFWIKLDKNIEIGKALKIMSFENSDDSEMTTISYAEEKFIVKKGEKQTVEIQSKIPLNDWICVVIGINNSYGTISSYIGSVSPKNLKTTSLTILDYKEKKIEEEFLQNGIIQKRNRKIIINNDSEVSLFSGDYKIRMLRISNYCIEKEHYSYIMGLKNVKKQSAFFIIDDCEKNINLFKVGKSLFPILDKTFDNIENTKEYEK